MRLIESRLYIKFFVACAIAYCFIPSFVRSWLYKLLLGCRIGDGCRIGYGTVICVSDFNIASRVTIGSFNIFKGIGSVIIEENAVIGSENKFLCGSWAVGLEQYGRSIKIGPATRITDGHYFDFTGLIEVGANTWIAGYGSQFWTHGAAKEKSVILIGKNNYLGSAVRICPGASIGNSCVVGIGSVLTKPILGNGLKIVGVPAKSKQQIENLG